MKQYLKSIIAFFVGYTRFDELSFKPGWSGSSPLWWFLYTVDNGTHVILSAGANVTWSRWFYETRKQYRISAFMNRLLNHIDDDHGKNSGPVLFNSVPCPPTTRMIVSSIWLGLSLLVLL